MWEENCHSLLYTRILDVEINKWLNFLLSCQQINVLQQIENICSHNFLQDTLRGNSVQLQGMWVDVHDQTTHIFNWQKMRFIEVQNVKEQVHDRTWQAISVVGRYLTHKYKKMAVQIYLKCDVTFRSHPVV